MGEPTQEEIQGFLRRYPRDVTEFATISNNKRNSQFDRAFYLYGFQITVEAECSILITTGADAPNEYKNKYKYVNPGHTFIIVPILHLESGETIEDSSTFVTIKEGYSSRIQTIATIYAGYKITKISFRVEGETKKVFAEKGGYYTGPNGVVVWQWAGSTIPLCEIISISLFEHPYIDSGMRIMGKDGKVYIPAETVFPSPLRIFHKRVRNIMLVPFGHTHASIFKIMTKDGVRAISTII